MDSSQVPWGETETSNPHPRKVPKQNKKTWNHKTSKGVYFPTSKALFMKTPLISAWESYHFNLTRMV